MRFSLMTEPQIGGTYDEILAAARWAEAERLDSFARSDHYYSSRDPRPDATDAFATLAGLARETTSIRLCVLVSPITFRHPAVIAKNAVTIDQMSGGRLDLGVGTGWMDLEHEAFGLPFPDWAERYARFEESLAYLEAAFADGHQTFAGTYYSLDADVQPTPQDLRIVIGGSGPRRTPALAGRHAHDYNHFVAPPSTIAPKIERMRAAAEQAGRDPESILVSIMGPVFAGSDETEYSEIVGAFAAQRDITIGEAEERLANAGIPHGTPDRVGSMLADLEAIGVERVYLQWLDLSDTEGLRRMWSAVQAAG